MPSDVNTPRRARRPVARSGDTVRSAYERLRELIIEGELLPGQRMTQAELGELAGVGRTPLREALRMLESDRLVVSGPNSGVRVAAAELGDAEELYAARLLLEPPILASVADELSDDELADLDAMLDELRGLGRRHAEFHRLHFEFHMRTYGQLSPTLLELFSSLARRVFRLQRVYMSRVPIAEDYLAVDERTVAALRAHDGELVRQLLELHIVDAAVGLIADVEPDHGYHRLLKVAASIGIEIEADADGRLASPAIVRWVRPGPAPPALPTHSIRVATR